MLARGLTLLYAVRLHHFAFWLGARLDISPTVSDVTVDLKGGSLHVCGDSDLQ
jgi:hypothetical protein